MASLFLVYAAIIVAWSFLAAVLSWKRTDIFAASAGGTKRRPHRSKRDQTGLTSERVRSHDIKEFDGGSGS